RNQSPAAQRPPGASSPEWSVASDAEGGKASGACRNHTPVEGQLQHLHLQLSLAGFERARSTRSSPADVSASGASGGQREPRLSLGKHRNDRA
ncbi:hypothetical protein ACFQE6_03400, partial [Natrinema soli]